MLGDGIDPVLLCHIPDGWLNRLTVRLAPDIPTRVVVTVTDLSAQLHRHPLSVAVIGLGTTAIEPTTGELSLVREALARHAERLAIGVLFSSAVVQSTTVSRLATLGLREIATLHDGRDLELLTQWIRTHRPQTLHAAVWTAIEPYVDPKAATLFKIALRLAAAPYEVADLAAACKTSERTLRRLCQEAGVPSPVWLKAMSRLLVAGFLLDRPHASVDAVAARLGFDSVDALQKKRRKWTGYASADLEARGWIASLGPPLAALSRETPSSMPVARPAPSSTDGSHALPASGEATPTPP